MREGVKNSLLVLADQLKIFVFFCAHKHMTRIISRLSKSTLRVFKVCFEKYFKSVSIVFEMLL